MECPTAASPLPIPRLVLLLKAARGYHVVDVRSILYAEADERFCSMHFTDGTKKPVFHTLNELEAILRCGERMGELLFLRVHKSHLVAFHHTSAIGVDRRVLLQTGTYLPIGRQYWAHLLKCCMSIGPYETVVQGIQASFNQELGSK